MKELLSKIGVVVFFIWDVSATGVVLVVFGKLELKFACFENKGSTFYCVFYSPKSFRIMNVRGIVKNAKEDQNTCKQKVTIRNFTIGFDSSVNIFLGRGAQLFEN